MSASIFIRQSSQEATFLQYDTRQMLLIYSTDVTRIGKSITGQCPIPSQTAGSVVCAHDTLRCPEFRSNGACLIYVTILIVINRAVILIFVSGR